MTDGTCNELREMLKLTGGVHPLYDEMIENHLLFCTFDDVLLDRGFRDQAIYHHLVLLTDTMSASLGLKCERNYQLAQYTVAISDHR